MESNLIEKILAKASKLGVECEVYCSKILHTYSSFENNKLAVFEDVLDTGIALRVLYNKKPGYASTCNITPKNLDRLIKHAIKLAKLNEENSFIKFQDKPVRNTITLYSDRITELSSSKILDDSIGLLNRTLEKSEKLNIKPVLSGGVEKFLLEIQIYNTSGFESKYKKTILRKMIYGKSHTPPSLECQVEDYSILSEGKSIDEISDEFVYKLKIGLKPTRKKTLNNKLILSPSALGELLYHTFGQAINGENMARGRSFLSDKIGVQIASEKVSLIDWGNSNNFVSARPFDGEGTSTRKNILIDHGVLKQAIYDIEWGARAGLESTGNAHRGYHTPLNINLNTISIPSTTTGNLIEDISKGYYIETITGAHTSNSVTGDFGVVVIGGYSIIDGEISKPIYGPLFSSSCLNVLNSIVDVAGPEEQVTINQTTVKLSPVMIEF